MKNAIAEYGVRFIPGAAPDNLTPGTVGLWVSSIDGKMYFRAADGSDTLVPQTGAAAPGVGKTVSSYASLSAAIAALGSSFEYDLVLDVPTVLTADTTITPNFFVRSTAPGLINLNGHTLTIQGAFSAGLFQVFTGSGTVVFSDGTVLAIYPQWWGAKGDGVTDCTSAFISAIATAEAMRSTTVLGTNKRGNIAIVVPGGDYLITSAEALIRSSYTTRTAGLVIVGAGREVTRILFQPSISGYLANNNDAWLNVHVQDMTFYSNSSPNGFFKSTSNGGAQNYTFTRVNWRGVWGTIFELEGTNNNSEMTWDHCGINPTTLTTFLNVPASPTGSDQFLNFNFRDTQFEPGSGDFIHMEQGGNVNVWGGSLIHTAQPGGTFFKMHGSSHSRGVCRLSVIGARVEHRPRDSKLCDIQWNQGSVLFKSCDFSSSAFISRGDSTTGSNVLANVATPSTYWNVGDSISGTNIPDGTTVTALNDGAGTLTLSANATGTAASNGLANLTTVRAYFQSVNTPMCAVKFEDCMLMGLHQYEYGINSWGVRHQVVYDTCEHYTFKDPSSAISIVATGGHTNQGGIVPVKFRNCRSNLSDQTEIWDCTLNYAFAMTGSADVKVVSIKDATGKSPLAGAPLTLVLPLNSIIVRILMTLPAGALGSAAPAQFHFETTEGTPTVLASVLRAQMLQGFNVSQSLQWQCDSDQKRTIKLVADQANQTTSQARFIVEYI